MSLGTKNVLDAMRRQNVRRLVFSSTAATYGVSSEMPLTEDSTQRPETPYGTTKLACEWMIREYARAYGFGYTLLRYFNASGADENGDHGEHRRSESHLIPLALEPPMANATSCASLAETGRRGMAPVRDYVHVEDLAQAHRLAVEAVEPGMGRAFCMGSVREQPVLEVLSACEEVVGRTIPYAIVDRRPGDPAVLVASPDRIMRELGWAPRYPDIKSIVRTAWQWHSTHPYGYPKS